MPKEWKTNVWGMLGIILSLLAFINEENRLFAGLILIGALVFYVLYSFSDEIEEYKERIEKLEENLKIHENLISMKAEIEDLKRRMLRK